MKVKLEKKQTLRASLVSVTCGICKKTVKEFGRLAIKMSYSEKINSFICRKCLTMLNIRECGMEDVFSAVVKEGIKHKIDIEESRTAAFELDGKALHTYNRYYSEAKHGKK